MYVSCLYDKKKEMWNKLKDLKSRYQPGVWCIGGDFNSIRSLTERKGICVSHGGPEIQDFNDFISCMELINIPMFGNRFTWFNLVGSNCSRLDRLLVTSGLIDLWNIEGQVVGSRCVSDHCPIWL